jgi:hypothetical protein
MAEIANLRTEADVLRAALAGRDSKRLDWALETMGGLNRAAIDELMEKGEPTK